MELFRERNTATTVYFPMVKAGSQDFATSGDWTPANADSQFSKDGAAFGTTNGTVTYEGEGIWSLALLATEVNGKVTVISIIDDATKAVEDQAIILSTYGDDSSQHPLNMIADFVIRRTFQNACDSGDGDTKAFRSLLGAIGKQTNKVAIVGGTLTVYEDDDTTSLGTQTVTTDSGADPITALDTT
jgi:hypothetical protein